MRVAATDRHADTKLGAYSIASSPRQLIQVLARQQKIRPHVNRTLT
jgi:hypothetical protein